MSLFFVHCQNGRTALMTAAEEGHEPIVAILLKHDANKNAADNVSHCDCMHDNV